MKPPGFGDEGQGRVQFKDKNNATLFVFKEKEQSWLCWAPQLQSGGNCSLGLPMAKLTAWFSLTTAREPTFLLLTIHFQALC